MKCAQRNISFRRLAIFENGNTIRTGRVKFVRKGKAIPVTGREVP
jgi:hypothetical protein